MTAREMYDAGYGCSCHINPPCSFCEALDEEEADAWGNGGMVPLLALWSTRDNQPETTACTCAIQTLMATGCQCGHLTKAAP